MYKLTVQSISRETKQEVFDSFDCPDLHAVRSVLKAYDLLHEKIIAADFKGDR